MRVWGDGSTRCSRWEKILSRGRPAGRVEQSFLWIEGQEKGGSGPCLVERKLLDIDVHLIDTWSGQI